MRRLRLRPVRLGPAPDPNRRKRQIPPTAPLEEHIEDFVGWMVAGGFSPEEAQHRGEWVREFYRETGVSFLTLPPEEMLTFIVECDRQLEQLDREEAEDLAEEPEH